MKTSDMFPGAYLSAADISPKGRVMTIQKLRQEQVSGEMKWVLYFEEEDRGLILNKTNTRRIEALYGDTKNWPGKKIMLRREKVEFKSDYVDGIRVHPVQGAEEDPDFDDELPD